MSVLTPEETWLTNACRELEARCDSLTLEAKEAWRSCEAVDARLKRTLTALEESRAREAVLRETLDTFTDFDAFCRLEENGFCNCTSCLARAALSSVSDSAREFVDRIRREAIEEAKGNVRDALTSGLLTPGQVTLALKVMDRALLKGTKDDQG